MAKRVNPGASWLDTREPGDVTKFGVGNAPRKGFRTVTPRIVVEDIRGQVAFLRHVFGATGDTHSDRPAEMKIGDSIVMVSSSGARELFPAFLYVYVDDVEAAHQRALAAGATELERPVDTPYGDRRSMVRDPFGNVWQIARVVEPPDEP